MLRAMIVDDEELSVKLLCELLADNDDIEICRTFLDPWNAYEYVKNNPIDIAFLDISMPEMNGMKLSGLLHELDASIDVVFITAYDDYAVEAFDMSALDYLMKPVTPQRMGKTLNKIRERHLGRTARLSSKPSGHATEEEEEVSKDKLTEQEKRIVQLVAGGLSNKEIAGRLNIGAGTVKFHMKNVYQKLGARNRVQALQRAMELKILQ
jgi:two-component system LytT family response regulator